MNPETIHRRIFGVLRSARVEASETSFPISRLTEFLLTPILSLHLLLKLGVAFRHLCRQWADG